MTQSDRYSKPLYEIFVISIVILWLPLKLMAYVLPFICIGWFILRSNSGTSLLRLLGLIALIVITGILYYFLYWSVNVPFITQNVFLFFITYGTFWFLVIVPKNLPVNHVPVERYILVIRTVILIESVLAITQVLLFVLINKGTFDAGTGDIAQGTLNPLSFLDPGANFNNQIFTNNLLALLIFYVPYAILRKRGIWVAILGFLAVVIASVWHLFIAFIAAVLVVTAIFTQSFFKLSGRRVLVAIGLFVIITITVWLQPRNFSLVEYYFTKIFANESPKSKVAVRSVSELPRDYPWVYIVGLGPGQYSSRAGLIGTGKYFGDFNNPTKLPLLKAKSSNAFDKYVYPVWTDVSTNSRKYGNSTMARPFFSALSVLIEFGFVATFIICILLLRYTKQTKRIYRHAVEIKSNSVMLYAMACAVFVFYLVLISFFENYMEVAQAIFLGLVLLLYFNSFIKEEYFKPTKNH